MNVTLGIFAHVDAGKTTLSEQLLYQAGVLRKAGRVDEGNTLLDSDPVERQRGITVFSAQASMNLEGIPFTLLDTPGHVDFMAEAERCLSVLDLAVMVLDGSGEVKAHTRFLFSLMERRQVPVIFFVNKSDLPSFRKEAMVQEIRQLLTPALVHIRGKEVDAEDLADLDDAFCESYLSSAFTQEEAWQTLLRLTMERKACPVLTGAALGGLGVPELLHLLAKAGKWLQNPEHRVKKLISTPEAPFRGQVYQIRHDASDTRLVLLRVLAGKLQPRMTFQQGEVSEKVYQLRLLKGNSAEIVPEALPGDVVAVSGLNTVQSGEILTEEGILPGAIPPLQPVLSVAVSPQDGSSPENLLSRLRILGEEDPTLNVSWDGVHRNCILQVMGDIQTEVLQSVLQQRYGIRVGFQPPQVLYQETIAQSVIGCGHYEPLRHYAEVRLRLEPMPRGSGICFESHCHEDQLDVNFQRLIRTHVFEKQHKGVLTGSPLTDVKVVLLCGRDHLKHTEGGDFRQATYRAIRQGLMKAENLLLEPWYRYTITVPTEFMGRVMNDLTAMSGSYDVPLQLEGKVEIRGRCPVRTMMAYPVTLRSFTHGKGDIQLCSDGYDLCHKREEVLAEFAYEPEADTDNPPGSVFCSHGAGFFVSWREADNWMHITEKDYTECGIRDIG